ncbi:carbohydrate kinase family protein [Lentzea californiensis]|uniref:carbohydrate kinase family protein n=1 Tax=Lentzea californiensis TaxID=438851 RepID=UPI0021664E76|nr:carbohydrate kinase [Lentzea californiensis]MCR3754523.1 fructokinase [Lentzea californiensis]
MIIVGGEALVDLVPDRVGGYRPLPGGSPANTAAGIGRLGTQTALLARLADDRLGALLRTHLETSNVDLGYTAHSAAPTTLAVVDVGLDGAADYSFYIDGCADGGWQVTDLPAALPPDAALHVGGSFALAIEPMAAAFETLLSREHPHRVITLDPNIRPMLIEDHATVRARFQRWLGMTDVAKVSTDDLRWIAPDRPLAEVVSEWHEQGPALVIVTRGAEGVYASGPSGLVELPGLVVDVTDTVGAGDAFMAGLLAALDRNDLLTRTNLHTLTHAELVDTLAYAQRVAAITCTRSGADSPWFDELLTTEARSEVC